MGTQFTEGAKERVTAQESVQRVQSVMDMLQPGLLGRTHGRNPEAQPWARFLSRTPEAQSWSTVAVPMHQALPTVYAVCC